MFDGPEVALQQHAPLARTAWASQSPPGAHAAAVHGPAGWRAAACATAQSAECGTHAGPSRVAVMPALPQTLLSCCTSSNSETARRLQQVCPCILHMDGSSNLRIGADL